MDLSRLLQQVTTPDAVSSIASQIGADPQQVQSGIATALPALLGGLASNARMPGGAESLDRALEQDHDGGLFDALSGGDAANALGGGALLNVLGGLLGGGQSSGMMGVLGGLLGGGRSTDGAGILGHIFGGQQDAVEDGVSRASGLSRAQTVQLLVMLAPVIMSWLGKMKRQKGLSAAGVADVLDQQEEQVTQPLPGVEKGGLARIFDRNGNGSIADDLAKIGMAVGGAYVMSQAARRSA